MKVRRLIVGVAALAALLAAGCAKKDPAVVRIEGSEPQRLAFGNPKTVQHAFTEKMKVCWFNAPGGLLTGYRYDLAPAMLETVEGLSQLDQVTIFAGQRERAPGFVIQFHAFNDNTLIATRNLSFPTPLAVQLKRDVESWIFGRADCATGDASAGYAQPLASTEDLKNAPPAPAASSSWPAQAVPSARTRWGG